MKTPHFIGEPLLFSILILGLFLPACGNPWLKVRSVPEDGYEQTLNYQFQARVHSDSSGKCQMMVVSVRPIAKMYSGGEPPSRLQLFDDDCVSPVRFERAHFISKETGEQVRLSGSEVTRFLGEYQRLENELMGWLWRAGVI